MSSTPREAAAKIAETCFPKPGCSKTNKSQFDSNAYLLLLPDLLGAEAIQRITDGLLSLRTLALRALVGSCPGAKPALVRGCPVHCQVDQVGDVFAEGPGHRETARRSRALLFVGLAAALVLHLLLVGRVDILVLAIQGVTAGARHLFFLGSSENALQQGRALLRVVF